MNKIKKKIVTIIQKIKNSTENSLALVLFFLTFIVYFNTMAPTVSFWDTGEFIATSHILGIPHPPGSPLFLLIGKFFSLIPISSDIAFRVNILSPIFSALTISLLFLICNQFIERLNNYASSDSFLRISSSFIASLTFAFTHSHWFNAVETEVYAFSGFITALVVYLILIWSKNKDRDYNVIYLMTIIYLFGLGTGTHLLNLLTIPFIALIIYFSVNKLSLKNFILTAFVALFVFLMIQNGIIKGLPSLALQIGFYSILIIIFGIVYLAYRSISNRNTLLSIITTSILLIIIGYSTYFTIFIRSGQNPAIDENNPETIEKAISYLNRDQYGSMSLLPRKFDNIPSKISVVGKPVHQNLQFSNIQNRDYALYEPSKQINFLFSYQIKKMYLRYFLWQFAGKGSVDDSFVSPFGANKNQDGVDWSQFGLPLAFIIGLFGAYFHFRNNKYDAFSLLVLFIMTGIAIVLYLNQDNPQPRERDYSYVGSFMAFSIWIALGIFGFINKVNELFLEKSIKKPASYFMIIMFSTFIPLKMFLANYHEHDRTGNYIAWDMAYNMLQTCKPNAILFTNGDNDTFPLWYLQQVEGIRQDIIVANLSLLNTPWYIKQLQRENIDNPFINMSEEEVSNIDFKAWSKKLISIPAPKDSLNNSGKIEWELKPTYFDVALRVQDLMVLRIIKDNNWNRPIYFAVTVSPTSMLNLDDYLTMEGLTYRLSNNTKQVIDVDAITKNLTSIVGDRSWFEDYNTNANNNTGLSIAKTYQPGYIYRNLANKDVYVDPQLGRLIQNYRTAFTRLAISHYIDKNFGKAEKILLDMEEKMPSNVISIPSKELQYQIAQLYAAIGNKSKLEYHLNELIDRDDLDIDDYLLYGKTFVQSLQDYEEAKVIFETIYNNFLIIEKALEVQSFKSIKITVSEWNQWQESLPEIVFLLYLCYKELGDYENATSLIEEWLVRSPADLEAKKLLEEIKSLENS
tara:strand:- start:4420 stop:7326 length:2907 start_codon:yes stop_codon:yes gene_type:complete